MPTEKNILSIVLSEPSFFTAITNECINLIHKTNALGVYCYLSNQPAGSIISRKELQNHFECSSDHIDKCLKYLKQIGAIEGKIIRNKGQISIYNKLLKINCNDPKSEMEEEDKMK